MRIHMAVHKIILALVLVAWLPSMAFAMTPGKVYESVKDSVVVVKAYDRQGKQTGMGSGVILPSGDIITNYHVVKGGVRYTVGRGKHAALGTMKAGDPDKDLCLLAAGLVGEPARLGKTAMLKVGDPVYAVGAPQGLELSLSEGIISQLRGGGPHPIIQTTVAISPGSSGGGLFNAKGELVGITTFRMKGEQSLNFAVPVEWVEQIAREHPSRWAGPPVPIEPKAPAATWLDRALAFQKAQDWQGLLAHSRRWTKAEPGNDYAWYSLGVAYEKLGRYPEAIKAYSEAVRLKPDYADAWYNLGNAYGKQGRYPTAIEAFREALRLKPDHAWAWYSLGVAYGAMGRHQEEIEAYREALRIDPDYAQAWNNLGVSYGSLGRDPEAIAAFREALRLNPDYAEAWYNLGTAYGKLGRYPEAIKASSEAVRLKPDHAQAWNNLGVAYAISGNRSAALEAVKELRRYDPQSAEKLFNLIMKP